MGTGNYYINAGTGTVSVSAEVSSDSVWSTTAVEPPPVQMKAQEDKPMKKRRTGYEVGSRVVVSKNPQDHGFLAGLAATIIYSNFPSLSIEFDEQIAGGHSGPDQRGKENSCWNIDASFVNPFNCNVIHTIKKDFEIGGKNMKGAEVTVLGTFADGKNSFSVVEFKENVGGHSADGLGKKGHCWSVPAGTLKTEKKSKSKKKDK